MGFKKYLKLVLYLLKYNYKTTYFNFKYLPFNQAILFPVIVSKSTYLREMQGKIIIQGKVRHNMIIIGLGDIGIFDNKKSRTIWQVFGEVIFKGSAQIGHGSKISVGKNGVLVLGDKFEITAESSISAQKRIEFGDNCLLSWEVLMMDSDFHVIRDISEEQINNPEDIFIANNVWIGCRSTILKGTYIPNNSVIGAGSLVSRKLEEAYAVYAGSPVKLLKKDISWSIK